MPSNSSSRLKTMSGFQSRIARRSSDKLSLKPSGITSWPAALRCEMTSYSVRHSSISFSVEPLSVSGGTRVECTSTSARTFFILCKSSQCDARQLTLLVGLGKPRYHPHEMCNQLAAGASDVKIQLLAALYDQTQDLMHQIFAEAAGTDHPLPQRIAKLAQQRRGSRRGAVARRSGKHLEQKLV